MVGQMPALAIGEGIQNTLRRGSGREDAFDGVERIGAEANGPFQGGEQIGAGIGALQGQDLERLLVAVALVADQAVEEAPGQRAEFGEAFVQEGLLRGGRPRADATSVRNAGPSDRVGTVDVEQSPRPGGRRRSTRSR